MPRPNRRDVIAHDEIQIVHCINRCVRRAFLCGDDPLTGNSYEHRRQWVRDRLEFLASIFGIDVLGFSVMANHLHVVLRTRPDVVREWSNADVARRWCCLFPPRREPDGSPAEPSRQDIDSLAGDHQRIAERRRRLSDISWFMRCTAEVIARQANREDECTGRFWEGRFRAQVLPDEAAVAACMAYVDLNPVRAGVAPTPENSRFTSVHERIVDLRAATAVTDAPSREQAVEFGLRAGWLAPIELEPTRSGVRNRHTDRRASNSGCLPMTLEDYLGLVDWTGRQVRRDKPGRIDPGAAEILDRLGLSSELWLRTVQTTGRKPTYHRVGAAAGSTSTPAGRRRAGPVPARR